MYEWNYEIINKKGCESSSKRHYEKINKYHLLFHTT